MHASKLFLGIGLAGFISVSFQVFAADSGASARAAVAGGPTNLDFESGSPGEPPPGWIVPKVLADQGFHATLTTNSPAHGKQCVEIRWPVDNKPAKSAFANLMQRVDAAPFRGKRIKVTAAIRVQASTITGRAQMWLRVDRPGGMGAFDNMDNRPIRSAKWADYSITADVAADAQRLNIGFMTLDNATAWCDNVRLETVPELKAVTEPSRSVSEFGSTNLVAFARP